MDINEIIKIKGRIIKVQKYANQENELIQGIKQGRQGYYETSKRYAGSNGTYLKFGEYHGMRLDIKYSLYDTKNHPVELEGKSYIFPTHFTVEVYQSVMKMLRKQRMPHYVYEEFLKLKGEKKELIIVGYDKESLCLGKGYASMDIVCCIPVEIDGKLVTCKQNVILEELQKWRRI